ncbi:MAG: hypothetical protein QXF45_00815 [Candidatus Caldarchaeum sp.]
MVKKFVDFFVHRIDEKTAANLRTFGFSHVCVLENRMSAGIVSGLIIYRKVLVDAWTRGDVLEAGRNFEGRAVVCVRPLTREALMTAGRDERIATVFVHGEIPDYDRHVDAVFKNPVEISVAELKSCYDDEKRWRNVIAFVKKAFATGKKIVMSSGAASCDEVLPPQQLAYVAAALTDQKQQYVISVSENPLSLLSEKIR